MTPWHRYFGIMLVDLFTGSSYVIELEKDLSFNRQFLDIIVLRKESGKSRQPLPDGLEDLADHNLITYKSVHEPLNAWAMDELLGHMVNYRKLVSPSFDKLLPIGKFRLFAICTRFPSGLARQVKFVKQAPGVYEVRWGIRRVKIVVLSRIADKPENAVWEMFSADRDKVMSGHDNYKFRRPDGSTVINELFKLYRIEGIDMPYQWEDYQRDYARDHLQDLTPAERLEGLSPDDLLNRLSPDDMLKRLSPQERLRGLSTDDLLRGLSPEEIEAYLRRHSKDKPGGS